jgi:hypothetical protein
MSFLKMRRGSSQGSSLACYNASTTDTAKKKYNATTTDRCRVYCLRIINWPSSIEMISFPGFHLKTGAHCILLWPVRCTLADFIRTLIYLTRESKISLQIWGWMICKNGFKTSFNRHLGTDLNEVWLLVVLWGSCTAVRGNRMNEMIQQIVRGIHI